MHTLNTQHSKLGLTCGGLLLLLCVLDEKASDHHEGARLLAEVSEGQWRVGK